MQYITDPRHSSSMTSSSSSSTARAAEPYHQGNIRMTLENSDLWRSFHNLGTEMIITKPGRRMFPHCNISVSGLSPYTNYFIIVDMVPVDNFRYKWNKEQWEVAGKAEPQPPCRTYVHPDSPAPGSHWMKQSISLLKLKLTNNTLDPSGHIILHSMHQYQPRFHVVQADDLYNVHWAPFQTFSFTETCFTAVTAYQNTKITKLKIDHNPFAKGFREEGTHGKSKVRLTFLVFVFFSICRFRAHKGQTCPENPAKKLRTEAEKDLEYQSCTDFPRLPYDPQREDDEVPMGHKHGPGPQDDHMSPWDSEQDPSHSLHGDAPMDFSSSEQLVPGQATYHLYRSQDFRRLPSPPSIESNVDRRHYESSVDVATVPDREVTRPHISANVGGPQGRPLNGSVSTTHMPLGPKNKPGHATPPVYGHHMELPCGQWNGPIPTQYPTSGYNHPHRLMVEHGHSHHHGNVTEWSQYPLFSYSCW
ncbi:T-box-containing protein TBX6L-like [Sardina pilchardus]|uniref:T-box-containing protein TBX6L-like n=1 Tax=Sardina pilchardus TaxID=27697 RepID=UPI002E14AE03